MLTSTGTSSSTDLPLMSYTASKQITLSKSSVDVGLHCDVATDTPARVEQRVARCINNDHAVDLNIPCYTCVPLSKVD
jgi:hypothetical protein